MNQQHLDEEGFRSVREDMRRFFAEEDRLPTGVSVAGLVTVKMDARFRVDSVTIRSVELQPDELSRLEQALVEAINQAIQEVTRRNAERLMQAMTKPGTEPRDR
jgi:DNA-binding protein YbaB